MSAPLHTVFLVYLLAALVWNLSAARTGETTRARGFDHVVLGLQIVLSLILLRDRLVLPDAAWLPLPPVRALFPAVFAVAFWRNLLVIRERGWRPTDPVLLVYDVAMGVTLWLAGRGMAGEALGPGAQATVHAHSVLQLLLGSPLAQTWTLSWHLPMLVARDPPRTLAGMTLGLAPAALAAFMVVIPAAFWSSSRQVVDSFAGEPTLHGPPRADLAVGVARWDPADPDPPPGDLQVWVLPYDHDGQGLPEPPDRLVLELRPPDAWWSSLPDPEQREALLLQAVQRLGSLLTPALVLPAPEPDGETSLAFPAAWDAGDWGRLLMECADALEQVSPASELGVRLAGTGQRSRALWDELVTVVDVIGPRLAPAGSRPGGARAADDALLAMRQWHAELDPDTRPDLWLTVGLSPLAFGEAAQARFVEGALARAQADPVIAGVIVDGWRDVGATRGLLRPDGSERPAAARLGELLAER